MREGYLREMNITSPARTPTLRPLAVGGALLWGLVECVALLRSRLARRA